MFDLDRFKKEQSSPRAGFADAIRELRAGRKTGHWIWYIFPQLAGLGRSPYAVRYGLAGPEEAAAYLRDPLLAERLIAAAAAVRAHVDSRGGGAATLDQIMGSDIDTKKLVSCMTLFARVAGTILAEEPRPELAALVEHAEAILAAAQSEGYERCPFTETCLANG